MSRGSTLILLGLFTVLMPFSGLPVAVRTFLTIVFGATVIGIGASIRARDAHAAVSMPRVEAEVPEVTNTPRGVSPI